MFENGCSLKIVNWIRTPEEQSLYSAKADAHSFTRPANYGAGYRNLVNQILFQWHLLKILRSEKPKIIIACDLDTLLTAVAWAIFGSVTIIYDQFDPFDSRINNKFTKRLIALTEKWASKKPRLAITANINRVDQSRREWFEMPNLNLAFTEIELKNTKIDSKRAHYTLYYAGIIQPDRGLLEAASAITGQQHWKMKINGYGSPHLYLKLEEIGRHQIELGGFVSSSEVKNKLLSAELYLATYNPIFPHNVHTASNKFFEAIMCRTPIVASKGTDLGRLVEKFGVGYTVQYGNPDAISEVLVKISQWDAEDFEHFEGNCATAAAQYSPSNYEIDLRSKLTPIIKESCQP
jgi:glycosyltransferase involved in cell wall biosynthesis